MPAFSHAAISVAEIARDALDISVSPRQNFSKPPPVPEIPIEIFTRPEVVDSKYLAVTAMSGYTVLEPSILIAVLVLTRR